MNIGQWLGKWVGSWFGAVGETDPGAMSGSSTFGFTASGFLSAQAAAVNGGLVFLTSRKKTKQQIYEERKRLGIVSQDIGEIPKEVARVVLKVANKAIQNATERREPDVMAWLLHEQQKYLYEQKIRIELKRSKQIYEAAYAHIFELAVIEALQQEEEAMLLMMMEL